MLSSKFSRVSTLLLTQQSKREFSRLPTRNFSGAHSHNLQEKTSPQIPEFDHTPKYSGDRYTGPSYSEISKMKKENMPDWVLTFYKNPLYITEGKMQYLYDHSGRRYLDAFGGVCTVSVGHCHPYVNDKLKQQVDRLWHTTSLYMNETISTYSEKLLKTLPPKLNKVMFFNSGSEANDFAMNISQMHTGNKEIIAVRNCYHGGSIGSNKLTSLHTWRPTQVDSPIRHTTCPDPYRGVYGGSRSGLAQNIQSPNCPDPKKAGKIYAQDVKETILHGTNGKIAGFWAEGIQGVGGTVQFPEGYISEAFKIARSHGGLCVMDEVQTGWGRTGEHYWGWQDHVSAENCPDIMVMAKSMGNGFPMAAVVSTEEIMSAHTGKIFFNTYGGNPLSMAVGEAVMDTIEMDGLQKNCKDIGDQLMGGMLDLQQKYEIVGDVRGKGLMLGLEFVTDKGSKERGTVQCAEVHESMKEDGILVGKGGLYGNVLRIKGPMCWSEEDAKFFLESLESGIQKTMERM
jgi:alanine-glyoxylate transaminase/(R)-3-amino-2-methylpropionate-pyruvate transaminase